MKMSDEHYAFLRARIKHLVPALRDHRVRLESHRSDRYGSGGSGDLDRAVRWAAHHAVRMSDYFGDYDAYDDAHIDTALRKIQKEFGF